MKTYGVVRLDKVQSSYVGNIESLQHTEQVENGSVCHIGALVEGERELKNVKIPTAETIMTEEIVLVATPEVVYDESSKSIGLQHFVNEAKKPIRAYHLTEGDIFSISKDMVDGTPVVGQYVVPQADSLKLAVAADLTGGTKFVGEIIALENLGRRLPIEMVVVQVKSV